MTLLIGAAFLFFNLTILLLLIILVNYFDSQRGSPLSKGQQILLFNTYNFHCANGNIHEHSLKLTATQLKLSIKTVRKYVNKLKDGKLLSPKKRIKTHHFKKFTEFQQNAILVHIQRFRNQNQLVTLSKLKASLAKEGIEIPLTTLFRFLKQNEKEPHAWKRRGQFFQKSKPDIHYKRYKYLKEIMDNRALPPDQQHDLVYLDESYCQAHHSLPKTWIPIKIQPSIDRLFMGGQKRYPPDLPAGAGERLVLLSAGINNS